MRPQVVRKVAWSKTVKAELVQPPQGSSPGPRESGKLQGAMCRVPKGKGSRETGSYRADSGFYSDCGGSLWRVLSRKETGSASCFNRISLETVLKTAEGEEDGSRETP